MKTQTFFIALTMVSALFSISPAHALTDDDQSKFKTIMHLSLADLADKSSNVIEQRHPEENWSRYRFPKYVFNDQGTEVAYKVAVKHSDLLGFVNVTDEKVVIPCYCTCDSFGHDNLLYCFYKNGNPNDGFDEHGAQCAVCIRQALLAFLWDDLGAKHEEIMAGMKEKFAPLIEKYHQNDH